MTISKHKHEMNEAMKRIIFIFAAAMFAGAVSAETWYFTGDEANDGSDVHAYTDPTVWKNIAGTYATAFSATDTYVLTNKGPGESSATVHGIRIHGAQRITAGVIVGIRHDTHAAFQRKQKLGMTDMLNEHGRSSFPEFYDAGLQPKKERERGGRDSPRRRHSAKD